MRGILGLELERRGEVRLDVSAPTLRRTSCVYRFSLHLLGLRSKCTGGIKRRGERNNRFMLRKHVNTSPGVRALAIHCVRLLLLLLWRVPS